jgi:hypothetical protein
VRLGLCWDVPVLIFLTVLKEKLIEAISSWQGRKVGAFLFYFFLCFKPVRKLS